MVKPIKLKYHDIYKPLLDPLLGVIKNNPALSSSFQNHNKSIYIIAKDEARGIYGGALLLKQQISSLQKKVGTSLLFPQEGKVWTCTVCIQMKENEFSPRYEFFCRSFYRNLYEKLIEFGIKEEVDFLWMMLEPTEHLSTELIGFWPYEDQIRPKQSLDGLFHGILALTGKRENKSFTKTLQNFREPYQELRASV